MKAALVLIPENEGLVVKTQYLSLCLQYIVNNGHFPLAKEIYDNYVKMDWLLFMTEMTALCAKFYVFTDFGIDNNMTKGITIGHRNNIPIEHIKLNFEVSNILGRLNVGLKHLSVKSCIPIDKITSETRDREVVDIRFIYYRWAKETFKDKVSLSKIAQTVGGKNHASIIHGIKEAYRVKELNEKYQLYFNDNGNN